MHAPQTKTLSASVPPEELFAVVLGVVESGKFTLTHSDPERHEVHFTSGKSAISWGQEYIATVTPATPGSTLQLVAGGHDEAPKALLDGWKNGRAANKAVQAITEALGSRAT